MLSWRDIDIGVNALAFDFMFKTYYGRFRHRLMTD